MLERLRAWLHDESGSETVEYVLITLCLLGPTALAFWDLHTSVLALMLKILQQLQP
jgi:hypothetical protein